jgi:hypothetical protein
MSYPSNGDFEVMPRGTMEEVRVLRAFVKDLTELDRKYGINTPDVIRKEIAKINAFYVGHVDRYPSNEF